MTQFDINVLNALHAEAVERRDTIIHQMAVGLSDWGQYQFHCGYLKALDDLILGEQSDAADIRKKYMER